MAQVRMLVHAVWSTKNRAPLLVNKNKRIDIFKHIKANAKGINLDFINGVADHVHVLVSLACDQTKAKNFTISLQQDKNSCILTQALKVYNIYYLYASIRTNRTNSFIPPCAP